MGTRQTLPGGGREEFLLLLLACLVSSVSPEMVQSRRSSVLSSCWVQSLVIINI